MKPESGISKAFLLSAMTACLLATTSAPDASARHKKSDKNTVPPDSQVSMEIFPIQRGYDGAQFIVTKAGYTVSIPGLGVAPDATQVTAYRDENNNIWYIDRNGTPVKLTDQQVQWGVAQINQQAQARAAAAGQQQAYAGQQPMYQGQQQYLGTQAPPPSTVVVQQQQPSSSSGVASGLVTGLAAAGGAMAGAALSTSLYHNNYGGIPYGVPVYHGGGGRYYYNGSNGNKVYVNNSNNNKSINQINQWNHQGNWQNTQHNYQATQRPANSGGYTHVPTQLPAHSNVNRGTYAAGHGVSAGSHTSHSAGRASRVHTPRVSGGGARGGRRR